LTERAAPLKCARMISKRYLAIALLSATACRPSTDVTVPPPAQTAPRPQKVVVPPARSDGRLPAGVEPLHYDLALDIDPAAESFRGEVAIDLRLSKPTSAVVLHGRDLSIERAEIVVDGRARPAEVSRRKAAGAKDQEEELVLVPPAPLEAGDVEVHISYQAPLSESLRGVYRVDDEGHRYVFTQLEPSDARRVFPSFDDPIYKVPFDLKLTVPEGYQAYANSPAVSDDERPDGRHRVTFATTAKMPTYLLAFAIGPFEVLEGPQAPVPLRVIAPPGRAKLGQAALDMAVDHLKLMGEYFGTPYPYAKLDLVAVPNFGPGAMENAGLITFREELLLLGPGASAKARRDVASVLAHELAHQWFGNLVTMKWWDDLWLNEGFATYMESEIVDRWDPETRSDLELLAFAGRVMSLDALPSARRVRQPVANTYQAEEAFDGITYIKGASVLKMIHRWVGDDAFRTGVKAYLKEHAGGNASADDLFAALGKASSKDVAAVARTFVDQTGVPLVSAKLDCRGPKVTLQARPYRPRKDAPESPGRWRIPVCVSYGGPGLEPGRACTVLAGEQGELTLPAKRCPAWILPNAGYDGYYRFALPAPLQASLARATPKRDVAEQVGFLNNTWALVQSGHVEGTELVEQLRAYGATRSFAVMSVVHDELDRIADALVTPEAEARFARWVGSLLAPTARRLGWDPKPGEDAETKLLRREVFTALMIHGDEAWMKREAARRARLFLEDPKRISADTVTAALRLAARTGAIPAAELRQAYLDAKTTAARIALVQALASLSEPAELEKTLAMVSDGRIRAADASYVARAAVAWADSRGVLVGWLEKNLRDLAARLPGFAVARLIGSLRRVCDVNTRDRAAAAFKPVAEKMGAGRRLEEALDAAELCIDLRRRQAEATSKAF